MQVTTQTLESSDCLGLRVRFNDAPVVKIHVSVKLPNPADPYRMTAEITLPQDRPEIWLDGVHAAFQRIQCGNHWAVRIDYANAIRYFNYKQLSALDKRSPGFSLHLYNVPQEIAGENQPSDIPDRLVRNKYAQIYYQISKAKKNEGAQSDK